MGEFCTSEVPEAGSHAGGGSHVLHSVHQPYLSQGVEDSGVEFALSLHLYVGLGGPRLASQACMSSVFLHGAILPALPHVFWSQGLWLA